MPPSKTSLTAFSRSSDEKQILEEALILAILFIFKKK
jgi:hypothetical protein